MCYIIFSSTCSFYFTNQLVVVSLLQIVSFLQPGTDHEIVTPPRPIIFDGLRGDG